MCWVTGMSNQSDSGSVFHDVPMEVDSMVLEFEKECPLQTKECHPKIHVMCSLLYPSGSPKSHSPPLVPIGLKEPGHEERNSCARTMVEAPA